MEDNKPDRGSVRLWLKCPECTWTSFHYRSKTKDYICHHCGSVFVADYDKGVTRLTQTSVFGPKRKEK